MDFPRFPIGPVIEYYGGEPVEADRGWHPVRCPFHGDRDASGSVRTDGEEVFHCFGCEIKGNAVQILMKVEGLGYRDAVRRVEEITGIVRVELRGQLRKGSSLSRTTGDWAGYSAFKRTWLRGESDDS